MTRKQWPSEAYNIVKTEYYEARAKHEKGEIKKEELDRVREALNKATRERQAKLRHRPLRSINLPD